MIKDISEAQPLVKKGGSVIQHRYGGINYGPMREARVIKKYSELKLKKLGKIFNQVMKEPFATRLVRLWNIETGRVSVTAVEAGKLSEVTFGPSLRQRIYNLRQSEGSQSLTDSQQSH